MTADFEAIHAQILPKVGEVHRQRLGRISAKEFQRFAYAIGDLNPHYVNGESPHTTDFPPIVAPPLFLSGVMGWSPGPPEEALRGDGTGLTETAGLPLAGLRLMGAGQDLLLREVIVDNMEIVVDVSVDDVELKRGRTGTLLILHILRRYFDGEGREVLTCRESFIAR